jgi:cation:H+ antiporter
VLLRSLSRLSAFLRLNEFIAAFILMAFCTSLPELFIGISSALAGNPSLSLGNVIGSNIIELTLVSGIAIVLARGIKMERRFMRKEVYGMVLLATLPMLLMFFGRELSRLDGLILLGAFAIYFYEMITSKHASFRKKLRERDSHFVALGMLVLFLASAALLYFSAKWAVSYGSELAELLGFPHLLVGLFFVALGTTLPDLTFSAWNRGNDMPNNQLVCTFHNKRGIPCGNNIPLCHIYSQRRKTDLARRTLINNVLRRVRDCRTKPAALFRIGKYFILPVLLKHYARYC